MVRLLLVLSLLALPFQAALAEGGMVSAADPRAAEAGREMLREGGSAVDAALAMMLALTVVEPQSSGIGGGGFLVRHDARNGGVTTIDGREVAPAAATANRFLNADGSRMGFRDAVAGGLSVGVPGNVRLMEMAHGRWGRLKWSRLFKPAIKLAHDGFKITPALHKRLEQMKVALRDFPAIRAHYYDASGAPKPVGARIKNPELARLLKHVAKHGAPGFYQGWPARRLSSAVATAPRNPSQLTEADLIAYRAEERPAVCGSYRGYRVCGMGPPSAGGIAIVQMLGMLERFDLKALGPNDPRSWHLIAEAMRLAYADRDTYIADPGFVPVPVAGLIDPGYIRERSALISIDSVMAKALPGKPPGAGAWRYAPAAEVPSTTSFAAGDGAGNLVAVTSTIEGPFGSFLMANGFHLNNELTDFSFVPERGGLPVANRVEPGKRPRSAMSPTIVQGPDGKAMLALGSAGGPRIIMHVMKTLVGVLDWGLPVDQAIALPNVFLSGNAILVEKGTSLDAMRDQLTARGHIVTPAELGSKVNAVERRDGAWKGGADPRSEGVALAE